LGGATRDRIRVYQTAGSEDAEEIAQLSVEAREEDFSAIKLYPAVRPGPIESVSDIEAIYQLVATVRDRVGTTIDVGIDFHGRISPAMLSRLISKLEPLEPMFIEEPIRPEFNYLLGQVRQTTTIPFAFGERLYSRWDFRPHFESRRIDIAQPDLSHAGGITEVQRIATLAETYGVALGVNCPNGPVAHAAATQLNAHATNSVIQPSGQSQYTELYLENPEDFQQRDGYVPVPDKPGLGIVVDEETVRERSMTSPDWRHPTRRHDDYSLAEW
jgi:galactonate dehydratase